MSIPNAEWVATLPPELQEELVQRSLEMIQFALRAGEERRATAVADSFHAPGTQTTAAGFREQVREFANSRRREITMLVAAVDAAERCAEIADAVADD